MRFRTKTNSRSGVFPIPIYTKPQECGGNCIFCPKESGLPNSYTSNEDTLFAKAVAYSPSAQFNKFYERIALDNNGYCFPCEIIVLGGSFSSMDREYRSRFLSELYSAMSGKDRWDGLEDLSAKRECLPSVVTVESRPDQINYDECKFLRSIGVSKVEIGVQHTSDRVLVFNNRGHKQSAIIQATRLLKEEGFKVGYHVMLGLPSATAYDDREMLSISLWKPEYSPDFIKIYPCILLRNEELQPELFRLYRSGKWIPPCDKDVEVLLRSLKEAIPSYVRISRIQRQFDIKAVHSGVSRGIRSKLGIPYRDISAREAGRLYPGIPLEYMGPVRIEITAKSDDIHIELLGSDAAILGIARIRKRSEKELVLRELKVFGEATPVGFRGQVQGKGLGSLLLSKVETLAVEMRADTILVNASPGARPFFKKRGYSDAESGFLKKRLCGRKEVSISKYDIRRDLPHKPL